MSPDPGPNADFETQSVVIAHNLASPYDPGRVMVVVNFQGDWCDIDPAKGRIVSRPVVVSGRLGMRYECDWESDGRLDEMVQFFKPDGNEPSYWVGALWSIPDEDQRDVTKIIESFRFLD